MADVPRYPLMAGVPGPTRGNEAQRQRGPQVDELRGTAHVQHLEKIVARGFDGDHPGCDERIERG